MLHLKPKTKIRLTQNVSFCSKFVLTLKKEIKGSE